MKIFKTFLFLILASVNIFFVFADDASSGYNQPQITITALLPGMSVGSKEEMLAGTGKVDCYCAATDGDTSDACGNQYTRKYVCVVPVGWQAFQLVIGSLVKYVVYVGLLLGVLALVVLGVAWSVNGAIGGGGGGDAGKKIKGWLKNAFFGLFVLFFFGTILRILAPWVYN